MVFGNFGEASEAVPTLIEDRVRVAGPRGEGLDRSEEGEKALAVFFVRRTLSLAATPAQSHSLLGRVP